MRFVATLILTALVAVLILATRRPPRAESRAVSPSVDHLAGRQDNPAYIPEELAQPTTNAEGQEQDAAGAQRAGRQIAAAIEASSEQKKELMTLKELLATDVTRIGDCIYPIGMQAMIFNTDKDWASALNLLMSAIAMRMDAAGTSIILPPSFDYTKSDVENGMPPYDEEWGIGMNGRRYRFRKDEFPYFTRAMELDRRAKLTVADVDAVISFALESASMGR